MCRLPQDIFQTAKVSKILIAINRGKGAQYKGKSLDEINLSDIDSADSDNEFTTIPKLDRQLRLDNSKVKHTDERNHEEQVLLSSSMTETTVRKQTSKKVRHKEGSDTVDTDSCSSEEGI